MLAPSYGLEVETGQHPAAVLTEIGHLPFQNRPLKSTTPPERNMIARRRWLDTGPLKFPGSNVSARTLHFINSGKVRSQPCPGSWDRLGAARRIASSRHRANISVARQGDGFRECSTSLPALAKQSIGKQGGLLRRFTLRNDGPGTIFVTIFVWMFDN
jgi:hypothetical protein